MRVYEKFRLNARGTRDQRIFNFSRLLQTLRLLFLPIIVKLLKYRRK
jgi:hypothetical protein